MLANDYTQVNDLGYGLFVNNAPLSSKLVRPRYYNHTAFLVTTVQRLELPTVPNANGNFGPGSGRSDPNETVDAISTLRNMQQLLRYLMIPQTHMALVHLNMRLEHLVFLFMTVITCPIPNSLIDIYTTAGVTTYEVTATSIVAVPTSNIGGYTGATGPNRT